MKSVQKMKFEVGNGINWKVPFCLEDITKHYRQPDNYSIIVNAANETLTSWGGIYRTIHEGTRSGLLHEWQKLNGCEDGDCKVTLGYKLPAIYVFDTVRPRDKYDIKLKDCYKRCLQNVLTHDVKFIAFCCVASGICGFDQRKAAEIALATAKLWLESNHSPIDQVVLCVYMKMQTMKYMKI